MDERRWRAAQEWEAALWAAAPQSQSADRNEHHRRRFGGYAALPQSLGHLVEFGSGPFTQLQTIIKRKTQVASIRLVDPLASYYTTRAKGCTYADGALSGRPVTLVAATAEDALLDPPADTLVLISVLQTVRDVAKVLQAAYNGLRPGGLLVFADRVFDGRWDLYHQASGGGGGAGGKPFWDVCHPCAVKQPMLDHFLSGFEELFSSRYTKGDGLARDEQLYFIGRKLRKA